MNMLTAPEFVESYGGIGAAKCRLPIVKMFLLAVLAGAYIALAGAMSNVAVHAVSNVSAAKILSGVLFPLGLCMVILTGAELFTGNCLIGISVMQGKTTVGAMVKNLAVVYVGNMAGSIIVAALCAFFGQMNLSDGALAVFTIKTAAAKCALPFANAFVLGILCNFVVCTAVSLSLCGRDVSGRILGAFVPVCLFVISGYEHCIANMYYIPAGLFAMMNPVYAEAAAVAGVDVSGLNIGGLFLGNLLPVTMGNIIGGLLFALLIGYCHGRVKVANR